MSRGRTGFGSLWMSLINNSFGVVKWSINTRRKRHKINSVFLSQSVNKCWKNTRFLQTFWKYILRHRAIYSCIILTLCLLLTRQQNLILISHMCLCQISIAFPNSIAFADFLLWPIKQHIYFTSLITDFLPNVYFSLLLCGKRDDI